MAVTPTGAPAWVRANDHTTYGGHASKRNYQGQGVVDPTSDVSAEQFSRSVADLAEIQNVAEFATFTVTTNDSSPAAPTISDYDAMAGAAPVGARNGDGDVFLTFLASYTDEYGVSGDLHIAHVETSLEGSTAGVAVWEIDDPDTNGKNERVRVRCLTGAGAAIQDATFTITVSTSVV